MNNINFYGQCLVKRHDVKMLTLPLTLRIVYLDSIS